MRSKVGMIQGLKDGQHYMNIWPMRKELNVIFPEQRIITATRFGIKIMPIVAVLSLFIQTVYPTPFGLPQAIVMALFALSLPLQGIWWLGNRANTQLPPSLISWYQDLHQKVIETGFALEPLKSQPRYQELALLLNRAFRQLDRTVLERWF